MVNNFPTQGRPPANATDRLTGGGNRTRSRSYDPRGNSYARRARKNDFLSNPKWPRRPGTEGTHVNCVHCSRELNSSNVQADKIDPSGGYQRHNVQPSCPDCNRRRGNDTSWTYS